MKTTDIYFEIENMEKEDAVKQFEEKYPELAGIFTEENLRMEFDYSSNSLEYDRDVVAYDLYEEDTKNYYRMEVLYDDGKVKHISFEVTLKTYDTSKFNTSSRYVVYDNSYKEGEISELESIKEIIEQINCLDTDEQIFYRVSRNIVDLYNMYRLKDSSHSELWIEEDLSNFWDIYEGAKKIPCFRKQKNLININKMPVSEFIDFVKWFYTNFHLNDIINSFHLDRYAKRNF